MPNRPLPTRDRHAPPAISASDFLVTLAEPTRLRILNCVAAAPLFVSDLVAVLGLPQPTVSRHLKVLRDLEILRDVPLPPFVLYTVAVLGGSRARMVRAVLDTLRGDPEAKLDRTAARQRSRAEFEARVAGAAADAS